VSEVADEAGSNATATLREVAERAERWRDSNSEWVTRSRDRVRRWTWAPAGSELHRPEVWWHERHGDAPVQELDQEPMGAEGDRYGYDDQGRVVIAYRGPHQGRERSVECFDHDAADDGVIWAASYSDDGRLQVVSRIRIEDGRPAEVIAYNLLIPLGDRRRMRREIYIWEAGRLARIDPVWGDWTKTGWQQHRPEGPGQHYEFEYDADGDLAGVYEAAGRIWSRPILDDADLQALQRRVADAVAREVQRLISAAHPAGPVYCVGVCYSPGLPEDLVLLPQVALGFDADRQAWTGDHVAWLWHPDGFSSQLGNVSFDGQPDLMADARRLARELLARGDRGIAGFFDLIGRQVAASGSVQQLPATDDMVVVVIDDSEAPTREAILRHASPQAREVLRRSRWLPDLLSEVTERARRQGTARFTLRGRTEGANEDERAIVESGVVDLASGSYCSETLCHIDGVYFERDSPSDATWSSRWHGGQPVGPLWLLLLLRGTTSATKREPTSNGGLLLHATCDLEVARRETGADLAGISDIADAGLVSITVSVAMESEDRPPSQIAASVDGWTLICDFWDYGTPAVIKAP
jgi:hypothetical protein